MKIIHYFSKLFTSLLKGNAPRVAAMKGVPVEQLKPITAQTVAWPLISFMPGAGEKAEEISKSQISIFPNFLGLVLGCIEAKFCK